MQRQMSRDALLPEIPGIEPGFPGSALPPVTAALRWWKRFLHSSPSTRNYRCELYQTCPLMTFPNPQKLRWTATSSGFILSKQPVLALGFCLFVFMILVVLLVFVVFFNRAYCQYRCIHKLLNKTITMKSNHQKSEFVFYETYRNSFQSCKIN